MAESSQKKEQETQMFTHCADRNEEKSRTLCLTESRQCTGSRMLRCGALDPELDDYIQSFVDSVGTTLQLGNLSLETPEQASQAIQVIAGLKEKIVAQRRTAQALRNLVLCANSWA